MENKKRTVHVPEKVTLEELSEIEYWAFDIDDTLYPKRLGINDQLSDNMAKYMAKYLKLTPKEAYDLCLYYYKKYGTTIRGIIEEQDGVISPRKFVNETHKGLDLSIIYENEKMREALSRIPAKKFVFTNGSFGHALRVCKKLGIHKEINGFFGTQATNFIPKPDPAAFEYFFDRYKIDPHKTIFFDDNKQNLKTAKELGMKTVLAVYDKNFIENYKKEDYIDYGTVDVADWLDMLTR